MSGSSEEAGKRGRGTRKPGKTETRRAMRKSDDERQINSVEERRTSKRDEARGPVRARFRGGWAAGSDREGEGEHPNGNGQYTRSRRDARILCAFVLFRRREGEKEVEEPAKSRSTRHCAFGTRGRITTLTEVALSTIARCDSPVHTSSDVSRSKSRSKSPDG